MDSVYNLLSNLPVVLLLLCCCRNEITLTGCSYDRLSATEPWKCPQGRTGFVRADPKSKYAGLFHTKVEMTVTRFDQGGIEFVRKEHNPLFGGDGR